MAPSGSPHAHRISRLLCRTLPALAALYAIISHHRRMIPSSATGPMPRTTGHRSRDSPMRLSLLCTFLLISFLALLPSGAQSDPPVIAEAGPKTPAEERQALELPPGFDLELVASEPDIHKPLNLSFDNQGRLWVTDTVEYPYPAKPGAKTRDTIKILDDFGPDGRARKITTFGRDLNIPIGNLPLHDGALVFSIPSVWRLRDQGDG